MRSSAEAGFTIIEVLVASFLGLMILAISIETAQSNQRLYQGEVVRTRISQNLRSALDLIGMNTREAGESLPASFPAFEVIDGGASADRLILRKNLRDEVPNVCTAIVAGSTVLSVYFAIPGTPPAGCVYSGQTSTYNAWRDYRVAQGNTVDAYIFNPVTRLGEFFRYGSEVDTGTAYYLVSQPRVWTNSYPVGAGSVYLLEEWEFKLSSGYLQLVQNGDTAATNNVLYGVTNLQLVVYMQDGSTRTSFAVTDAWSQVASLQVTLTGSEVYRGTTITKSLSARFFPRNILSL